MNKDDTLQAIGKIIPKGVTMERDAVHIAVAPVVAAEPLERGAHIGLLLDGTASVAAIIKVGIVDPYLQRSVKKSETFYVFLYPGSITSLTHHWSHPAFLTELTPTQVAAGEGEEWIRKWAEEMDITGGFERVMEAAANTARGDWDFISEGAKFESADVPDEFWDMFEKVQGTTVLPENRNGFFSCSC